MLPYFAACSNSLVKSLAADISGREGGREGRREGGRQGGREIGREGGREGGKEGRREQKPCNDSLHHVLRHSQATLKLSQCSRLFSLMQSFKLMH